VNEDNENEGGVLEQSYPSEDYDELLRRNFCLELQGDIARFEDHLKEREQELERLEQLKSEAEEVVSWIMGK
jgi:hypothetical protein